MASTKCVTSKGMSVVFFDKIGCDKRKEEASGSTRMLNSAQADQLPIRVLEDTVPMGADV